jgi:hypothetical protein
MLVEIGDRLRGRRRPRRDDGCRDDRGDSYGKAEARRRAVPPRARPHLGEPLPRSHASAASTGGRDALRLPIRDDRRVLDEEHARSAQDRVLQCGGQACSPALDDAMPDGFLPDLQPGEEVSLRPRASGFGQATGDEARTDWRATTPQPACQLGHMAQDRNSLARTRSRQIP